MKVYPFEVGPGIPPAVARLLGEGCQEDELSPAFSVMAFPEGGCRGAPASPRRARCVRGGWCLGAVRAPQVLHPPGRCCRAATPLPSSFFPVLKLALVAVVDVSVLTYRSPSEIFLKK